VSALGSYRLRGTVVAAIAAALSAVASPAAGSVTIGQVADPVGSGCGDGYDWIQPTVTSGNAYVVPGPSTGRITSWTTFGGADMGDKLTMKLFRPVPGQADFYQAVGHAGPETVTPGGTAGNTFPADIPAKPGDVLGFHTVTQSSRCAFQAPADEYFTFQGDVQDGQPDGPFLRETAYRLDIQATFVADNSFSVTGTRRNKKKGTATLSFNLPNPGDLSGSGKGAKVASAGAVTSKAVPAGAATLLVKAKGKKKRKLNDTGKVKLGLSVTYTPTGGDPKTQPLKVKLKKKI
jgi:hypothetical protein